MLVLSRHKDESVILTFRGPDGGPVRVRVVIVDIRDGDKVRVGFDGPPEVIIHREEVRRALDREAEEAARTGRPPARRSPRREDGPRGDPPEGPDDLGPYGRGRPAR